MRTFSHLHTHDEFSFLDGLGKIEERVKRAKELGQPALAQTNHGNLSGTYKFYKKCKEHGIKPILGVEVYVTDTLDKKEKNRHLILLAKNYEGFKNLCKIITKSNLEGFYYRPRVKAEWLLDYHQGLLLTSGCINSYFNDYNISKIKKFIEVYRDDFYIEYMPNSHPLQIEYNLKMRKIAKLLKIKEIITNDVHYTYKDDELPHEVLVCINTKKKINEKHFYFEFRKLYMMFYEEIKGEFEKYHNFVDFDYLIDNVNEIVQKCNVELDLNTLKIPKFSEEVKGQYFKNLIKEKFKKSILVKQKNIDVKKYLERIAYEFKILKDLDLFDYFLIVYDFINFANANNILTGYGRGSVCGSLIAYVLGITKIDPIKFNLIFERFINPYRMKMPDIDTDFEDINREVVKTYLIQKYGVSKTASIGTFSQLSPKALLRDVGRVFDVDLRVINSVAKTMNVALGNRTYKSIEDEFNDNPKFNEFCLQYPEIYKCMCRIQGQVRHISVAAGGVVIGTDDLTNYFSLRKKNNIIISEIDREDIEDAKFLKIDILGLKTLTLIKNIMRELKLEDDFMHKINLDDKKVYRYFQEAKTTGIFQFESEGMRNLMQKLRPKDFNDLIILNALYRPGTLEILEEFIKRKHGHREIQYGFEGVEDILKETYGLVIFQEQLIYLINRIGKLSYAESDLLRYYIDKQQREKIEEYIEKIKAKDIPDEIKNKFINFIRNFRGYLFNKSHATGYAMLAYLCMYFKVHYPLIFYKNLLNTFLGDKEYVRYIILESYKEGIRFNKFSGRCSKDFTVSDGKINIALSLIKGFGVKKVEKLEMIGNFDNFDDFVRRLKLLKEKIKKSPITKRDIRILQDLNFFNNIPYNIGNIGKDKIDQLNYLLNKEIEYLDFLITKIPNKKYINLEDLDKIGVDVSIKIPGFVTKSDKINDLYFINDSFYKVPVYSKIKLSINSLLLLEITKRRRAPHIVYNFWKLNSLNEL